MSDDINRSMSTDKRNLYSLKRFFGKYLAFVNIARKILLIVLFMSVSVFMCLFMFVKLIVFHIVSVFVFMCFRM